MAVFRTHLFYQWENSSLCRAPAVAHSGQPHTVCSQSIHNSTRAVSPFASPSLAPLWVVPGLFLGDNSRWQFVNRPPYSNFLCRCHWTRGSGAGHVWACILRTQRVVTKPSYLRLKTSYLDGNLQYSFQAIWEVTVETRVPWQRWLGVTEETTVAMETASQRAIFEASKEKHAPSLISVCVRERAVCFSSSTCLAPIMRHKQ